MRRMVVAVALVVAAGCAGRKHAATTPAVGQGAVEPLQERAATLFDAAEHGDVLKLKTMVDWARWRTFVGLRHSQTDAEAAEVLSHVEAEPQPSAAFVDEAVRALQASLAGVAAGPMPPRAQAGVMNAELAAWRRGPADGAPPSLARLQTLVADSLADAREVTYAGVRRVTLVFVDELLVGILEAR